jgi:hypothetical protein
MFARVDAYPDWVQNGHTTRTYYRAVKVTKENK